MLATVVSRPVGEGRCWDPMARGEQVFVYCVDQPAGGTLDVRFVVDPSIGECLAFPSGSLAPSGWAPCEEVMPECEPSSP